MSVSTYCSWFCTRTPQALGTFKCLWVVQMVTLHQKVFALLRHHLRAVFLGIPFLPGADCSRWHLLCSCSCISCGSVARSRGAVCQQSAGLLCLQQWKHSEHSFTQKTVKIKSRLSSTKPIIILLKFHKVNLLTSLKDNRIVMAYGENKSNSNIA